MRSQPLAPASTAPRPDRASADQAAAFTGSPLSTSWPLRTVSLIGLPVADLAGQDLLGQRVLHLLLDHALQGPRAVGRVVALVGEPRARRVVQLQGELAVGEQLLQPADLDVDDRRHLIAPQAVEQDDLVDAVQELGPELGAHLRHDVGPHGVHVLALLLVGEELRADVGRHDDQRVLEVDGAALAVGQAAVVEHLQEHVEHVRVRLLDLVEQHHLVGAPAHGLGERAALLVADVARRRADQAGDGVLLHVLATCRCAPWRSRRRTGTRRAPWSARSCRRRSGPGR